MRIGFLGAGSIAQALLTRLAAHGHTDVLIANSRDAASLEHLARRYGCRAVDAPELADADLVFLCVPWSKIPAALDRVAWSGQILVDTTNPLEAPLFRPFDLGGRTSSEVVASLAAGARLVKGANTLPPHLLGADPVQGPGRRLLFCSGSDDAAKDTFTRLMKSLGFAVADLGDLPTGGRLHQFPGGPLPARDFVEIVH